MAKCKYVNRKSDLLGMPLGTAWGRLRKKVLFLVVQDAKKDICYRCGKKIESVEELSIEHKIAWETSEEPFLNFFDLSNIAFSHLKCNIAAAKKYKKYPSEQERQSARKKRRWQKMSKEERKVQRRTRYEKYGC